jgi:hypothetical protein
MSFLTLAGSSRPEENRHMHPYVIDPMVAERQQELHRLSRLDHARPGAWRANASRALVALAVHLGVPRPQRATTRDRVVTALGFEPPC